MIRMRRVVRKGARALQVRVPSCPRSTVGTMETIDWASRELELAGSQSLTEDEFEALLQRGIGFCRLVRGGNGLAFVRTGLIGAYPVGSVEEKLMSSAALCFALADAVDAALAA